MTAVVEKQAKSALDFSQDWPEFVLFGIKKYLFSTQENGFEFSNLSDGSFNVYP